MGYRLDQVLHFYLFSCLLFVQPRLQSSNTTLIGTKNRKGANWRNLKQDQKATFTCSLLFPFQIKYKEIQEVLFHPSVSCAWTSMIILDYNPKSVSMILDCRSLILVLKLCYFDNSRISTSKKVLVFNSHVNLVVGGHCRHSSKQRMLNHFLKTSQIGPVVAHILTHLTYILTHLTYILTLDIYSLF